MKEWRKYLNFEELYQDNRWRFPLRQLIDIKYWFLHRFHPKRRYHVHKFRHLKPGWHDVDGRMLHACFDLLCDFVEREEGLKSLKYQWTYQRDQELAPDMICSDADIAAAKHVYDEVNYLYNWWNETVEARMNGDRDEVDSPDAKEDDENMIRLIKVRRYLWT